MKNLIELTHVEMITINGGGLVEDLDTLLMLLDVLSKKHIIRL